MKNYPSHYPHPIILIVIGIAIWFGLVVVGVVTYRAFNAPPATVADRLPMNDLGPNPATVTVPVNARLEHIFRAVSDVLVEDATITGVRVIDTDGNEVTTSTTAPVGGGVVPWCWYSDDFWMGMAEFACIFEFGVSSCVVDGIYRDDDVSPVLAAVIPFQSVRIISIPCIPRR